MLTHIIPIYCTVNENGGTIAVAPVIVLVVA